MAYVKLDDDFEDHPKVLAIPRPLRNAAVGVYARGLMYSCRHESDGALPVGKFDAAEDAEPVAALVTAGLWHEDGTSYVINDYLDWNRSSDEIERIREERRTAGKRGGEASGKARAKQDGSKLLPSCFDVSNPTTETKTETKTYTKPPKTLERGEGKSDTRKFIEHVESSTSTISLAWPAKTREAATNLVEAFGFDEAKSRFDAEKRKSKSDDSVSLLISRAGTAIRRPKAKSSSCPVCRDTYTQPDGEPCLRCPGGREHHAAVA